MILIVVRVWSRNGKYTAIHISFVPVLESEPEQ